MFRVGQFEYPSRGWLYFDLGRPPRDQVDERGGSGFRQACKQRQVRNRHFPCTGFYPANSTERHL